MCTYLWTTEGQDCRIVVATPDEKFDKKVLRKEFADGAFDTRRSDERRQSLARGWAVAKTSRRLSTVTRV
jgi:hypothetical protein